MIRMRWEVTRRIKWRPTDALKQTTLKETPEPTCIHLSFFCGTWRGEANHRATWLTQLGEGTPPSSIWFGRPFGWIMTQPPARHGKHLLVDWLINSRSTSLPTIHCAVCRQTETTTCLLCQAYSRSLWWRPTKDNQHVICCCDISCNLCCCWSLIEGVEK